MANAAQVDAAFPTGAGQSPNRALANALLKDMLTSGGTLRNVATRPSICQSENTGNKQCMSRSAHVMSSATAAIQLVYGNWRVDWPNGETGFGATMTFAASIEYPAGTFTQVTFNAGATSGTAPNLGEVISDEIPVNIPVGAQFWVRTWTNSTGGIFYSGHAPSAVHGEGFEFGATTADKTMGGTVGYSAAGIFTPQAIIGRSNRPAIWLAGDSRTQGQADTYTDCAYPDLGILARSVGPTYAYINCGVPAEKVQSIVTAGFYVRRLSLAKRFCTAVLFAEGINDTAGRTTAQIIADLQTAWAAFAPLPVFACTLGPSSTSTDGFATTVNQTTSADNATRVAVNNFIRFTGKVAGVFELADVTESARDSGLWKAPGYTADGIHELQRACLAISNSRAIELGRMA